jgi:hypothetical protein
MSYNAGVYGQDLFCMLGATLPVMHYHIPKVQFFMLYDNFKVYFTGQGVENLEILFMIKK